MNDFLKELEDMEKEFKPSTSSDIQKMDGLEVNASMIKAFLFRGEYQNEDGRLYYCPLKTKEVTIDKKYNYTSDSMNHGNYFEYLCIGENRYETVTDLPRKKLSKKKEQENIIHIKDYGVPLWEGEKTTDQIRIEAQAELFKDIVRMFKMRIDKEGDKKNIQVNKKVRWGQYESEYGIVYLSGTADIDDTPFLYNDELLDSITVDLKLTKNINTEFGDYCWGTPQLMDHTQAFLYMRIFQRRFLYMVFDYKPTPEWKIVPVKFNSQRDLELDEAIRKTVERVRYHTIYGWNAVPQYYRCKDCPVNHIKGGPCKEAINIQEV